MHLAIYRSRLWLAPAVALALAVVVFASGVRAADQDAPSRAAEAPRALVLTSLGVGAGWDPRGETMLTASLSADGFVWVHPHLAVGGSFGVASMTMSSEALGLVAVQPQLFLGTRIERGFFGATFLAGVGAGGAFVVSEEPSCSSLVPAYCNAGSPTRGLRFVASATAGSILRFGHFTMGVFGRVETLDGRTLGISVIQTAGMSL